jgi:hypothetical protein
MFSAAHGQPLNLMQQHLQWQRQQHRQYSSRAAAPSSKDLADILKLQLLQDKSADDVEHIWMAVRRKSSYFDNHQIHSMPCDVTRTCCCWCCRSKQPCSSLQGSRVQFWGSMHQRREQLQCLAR